MKTLFRRLHHLLNRRRFERELASDMQFHREMAARAGRTNFGNMLILREDAAEAWDGPGSIVSFKICDMAVA